MTLSWSWDAWDDYQTFWHKGENKAGRRKIDEIVVELKRNPDSRAFSAEKLRYDLSGWSSMRIDREHRVVYRTSEKGLEILSCRRHYGA